MKKLFILTLFCVGFFWQGGNANAATVSVCASGCTTTSLQTALDTTAACGDTIQIKSTEEQVGNFTLKYRGCVANPIIVTSDRAAWLPGPYQRITPSHLGNMARITTVNSLAAIAGIMDGSNRPAAGWIFIGVAIQTRASSYFLVSFNVMNTTASDNCMVPEGCAASAADLADNITFDRSYLGMPASGTGYAIQDAIRADVKNITVKNSFFADAYFGGFVESHAIRVATNPGPVTAINNFITTSAIPIFIGGTVPSYPTYMENGITVKYNTMWRPWKYNGDPNQPYAADYVTWASPELRQALGAVITNISNTGLLTIPSAPYIGDFSLLTITGVTGCTVANAPLWRMRQVSGTTFQLLNFPGCNATYISGGSINEYAKTVCMKNLGELKFSFSADWEYNFGENSWQSAQCMSQFNGFTDTLRTEWNASVYGTISNFTMVDTTHLTWTGAYRIGDQSTGATSTRTSDLGICVSLPTTGLDCRKIASFSGTSLVTTTAFPSAPAGTYAGWISYTGSAKLTDTLFAHNVMKNTDQGFTILGLSYANGVGEAGMSLRHSVHDNLWYTDSMYFPGYHSIAAGASEADYSSHPSGLVFDHNTFYYAYGSAGSFVYAQGQGCGAACKTSIQPKFDASHITNNIFGVSSAGPNGPFAGDSFNNFVDTANFYYTNTNFKNNVVPGAVVGTNALIGGNAVSGNIISAWSDPFGGGAATRNFTVVPGATGVYHGGTDGASMGADVSQLPLLNNLTVVTSISAASLQFDVSAPISDVKGMQPCALEVSTDRNLASDLGTYAVIPNLDPTMTMGADSSLRSDVTLVGAHVTWPLIGLTSGVTYYGRVQCYGDSEQFTFVATPGGGTSISGSTQTGKVTKSGNVTVQQ